MTYFIGIAIGMEIMFFFIGVAAGVLFCIGIEGIKFIIEWIMEGF